MLSSGQDFGKNFLDSKHVLKVYFKPSRKNPDFYFLFLPLSSELVWLKTRHLNCCPQIELFPNSCQYPFIKINYLVHQGVEARLLPSHILPLPSVILPAAWSLPLQLPLPLPEIFYQKQIIICLLD